MPGLGTIINVGGILAGGLMGLLFGRFVPERVQDSLMKAIGAVVIFIGITGVLEKMVTVEGQSLVIGKTMMVLISMSVGTVIGELIDIEKWTTRFGDWLKRVSKSDGDNQFINAFVTTSLTVCIGAMAVVGSIEDGANGNYMMLATKAILDLIIVMIFSVSLGKGCIFSAIPVALFQGSITALANVLRPFITDPAMNNLSLVGSLLIFIIGVNLTMDTKIRVANMLPAIFIAMALSIWW